MFDIGWSELLVIGVVALIVVGPKDLPVMFRTLGRMTGKARSMAREFSRAMDDAARESGVKDIGNDIKAATSKKALGLDALEKAADRFEKWDPKRPSSLTQAKPATAKAADATTTEAKPMGPATQALADDRAAASAVRSAAAAEPPVAVPDPAAAPPAETTAASAPVKRIAKTRSRPDASAAPVEKPAKAQAAAPAEKPAKAPKAAKPKAEVAAGAPAEAPKRKRAKTDKGDA